jgi:SAM-dependent methyltransferase
MAEHSERHTMPNWEEAYANNQPHTMPWYCADLDPDVDNAFAQYPIPVFGSWLDLGTGSGKQALHLYEKGYQVTGCDISPSAIQHAKALSNHITWTVDNILDTKLTGPFGGVLDRGVFHVFHEDDRQQYVANVSKLIKPEGWLLLKCFSTEETMPDGPYRFTPEKITTLFGENFTIHTIKPTIFHGTFSSNERPLRALWCVMQRKA